MKETNDTRASIRRNVHRLYLDDGMHATQIAQLLHIPAMRVYSIITRDYLNYRRGIRRQAMKGQ